MQKMLGSQYMWGGQWPNYFDAELSAFTVHENCITTYFQS